MEGLKTNTFQTVAAKKVINFLKFIVSHLRKLEVPEICAILSTQRYTFHWNLRTEGDEKNMLRISSLNHL